MQKQTYGRERGSHSTSIGIVRPMKNPLKSFFLDTISPIWFNDKVIMLLLTSQPVKDIKDKSKKPLFCLKTPTLKLSTIKSNLPNMADFFIRKKSFSPISDDMVKICYDKLDYLNYLSSPTWSSSSILPNLNNKDKER